MEKLGDVQFHPRHDQSDPPIDTVYALESALESEATGGPQFRVTAPDKKRLEYLRDFLDAIVALNARGLMWGDVKQENCGVDGEGRLRIFDFGTFTRPIDDENRYSDILAYGKILYNALVQAYAFAPGRHCREHRFALNKAQLVSTVALITGASVGVSSALRECFSLETSSSFDDIAHVVSLLHAALLELREQKKNWLP
jgi:serine/threonine protein kinase